MTNVDSSTGGYLAPTTTPAPLEDSALYDFLHDVIAGITGLAATSVRPRWQPEPPEQPESAVDWLAFGIMRQKADMFPYVFHVASGSGKDIFRNHEEMEILSSSYGPNAQGYASRLRDGLYIAQCRESLFVNGMGLIETGEIISVPELVSECWLNRADLTIRIRREIRREYPVLNILSFHGTLYPDPEGPGERTFNAGG